MYHFGPKDYESLHNMPRVDIPVGHACEDCTERFTDRSCGVVIRGRFDFRFHRECFFKAWGLVAIAQAPNGTTTYEDVHAEVSKPPVETAKSVITLLEHSTRCGECGCFHGQHAKSCPSLQPVMHQVRAGNIHPSSQSPVYGCHCDGCEQYRELRGTKKP